MMYWNTLEMSELNSSWRRNVTVLGWMLSMLLVVGLDFANLGYMLSAVEEYWHAGRWPTVVSYVGLIGLGWFGTIVLMHARNAWLFWPLWIFLGLLFAVTITAFLIKGESWALFDMILLVHDDKGYGSDFKVSYAPQIYAGLTAGATLVLSVGLLRARLKIRLARRLLMLPLLALAGTLVMVWSSEAQLRYFPTGYRFVAMMAWFANRPVDNSPRQALRVRPADVAADTNVIWIIDESIGAGYLGINGYRLDTTPFLASNTAYVNLGPTNSVTNCSFPSKVIWLTGLQLHELPDTAQLSRSRPTIFQYAKNAGYQTSYIYSYQLDVADEANPDTVDRIIKVEPHGPDADQRAIRQLNERLKEPGPHFVILVKYGTHFRWHRMYPHNEQVFAPALGDNEAISSDRDKAVNTYANAVRWSVDRFFEAFLDQVSLHGTVVLYTSDHGQSVEDDIWPVTHCKVRQPHSSEATVPLLVFAENPDELFHGPIDYGQYSGYQLFSTSLGLMGYSREQLAPFGPSVFERAAPESRLFYSGDLYARGFHRKTLIPYYSPP